jgi:curved DNA-binding protein CbpA
MDRSQRDPYSILGVPHGSSRTVVAAAYRRLAKLHHPDAGAAPSDAMRDVNWAWSILSNPERRRAYDAERARRAAARRAHWTPPARGPAPATPRDRRTWAASGEPWSNGRAAPTARSAGFGCLPIGILVTAILVFVLISALMPNVRSLGEEPLTTAPGETTAPIAP